MKFLKKTAVIVLAVVLVFALCSCGKVKDTVDAVKDKAGDVAESVLKKEASVDGKWIGKFNMGETFAQALAEADLEGADPTEYFDFSDFYIPFVLELNSDKTYEFDVDRDAFAKVLEDQSVLFAEGFRNYFNDMMSALMEEEGMELEYFLDIMGYESLDDFISDSLGMSIDEYAKAVLEESYAEIRDDEESFKAAGNWDFKNNIVILDEGGSESEGTYDEASDTITYSMAGMDDETFSLDDAFVVFERG